MPKFTQLLRGRARMGRKPGNLVPERVLSAPALSPELCVAKGKIHARRGRRWSKAGEGLRESRVHTQSHHPQVLSVGLTPLLLTQSLVFSLSPFSPRNK